MAGRRRGAERWRRDGGCASDGSVRNPDSDAETAWPGQYVDLAVQLAWEAWQEAFHADAPAEELARLEAHRDDVRARTAAAFDAWMQSEP